MRLIGEHIYLGALDIDCYGTHQSKFQNWLEDPDVVVYTGYTKTMSQTKQHIRDYLTSKLSDPNCRMFGIFTPDKGLIGTIRLDIDWMWRVGVCSLLIGNKGEWGKGYGTEAIALITDFGFNTLGLHRIEAGVLNGNIASKKAFIKVGFTEEGRRKGRRFIDGNYTDEIMLSIINKECKCQRS